MTRLPPPAVAAIQARAEAATPGPWKHDLDVFNKNSNVFACVSDEDVNLLAQIDTETKSPSNPGSPEWQEGWALLRQGQEMRDAAFIAHARDDIPALLADRAALVAEVERLNAGVPCPTCGRRCQQFRDGRCVDCLAVLVEKASMFRESESAYAYRHHRGWHAHVDDELCEDFPTRDAALTALAASRKSNP